MRDPEQIAADLDEFLLVPSHNRTQIMADGHPSVFLEARCEEANALMREAAEALRRVGEPSVRVCGGKHAVAHLNEEGCPYCERDALIAAVEKAIHYLEYDGTFGSHAGNALAVLRASLPESVRQKIEET